MRFRRLAAGALAACAAGLLAAPLAEGAKRYGYVTFPQDEHQKPDGWNYWWGTAQLVTKSGRTYTVGLAYDSFHGVGAAGHQVFPRQGPYKGQSILSQDGPAEWGHQGETQRYLYKMSVAIPGQENLFDYQTFDTHDGLKEIGRFRRTSATSERYHVKIDNATAKVHPNGKKVKLVVDLDATMASPPLLLGGTGRWWYGIPQTYKYPSRSFQYMQAARKLTGTLELEQPDGSVVRETVVPSKSTMTMVHEYDASPEDLYVGLALAESTQLHPRYAQYYSGGMPWELIFVDLKNGAQLMLATLAFHETEKGTITPVVGKDMPTYQVLATLRLPTGESIPLDEAVHVEHLSFRQLVGNVPTFAVQVKGIFRQSWDFRAAYPGGTVTAPNGKKVRVPAFDLGLTPAHGRGEPALDPQGNGLTQRVPYRAQGTYNGCPVRGFGWSELIINWYGKEDRDPWHNPRGKLPKTPKRCTSKPVKTGTTGPLKPVFGDPPPPDFTIEKCETGGTYPPRCEYTAKRPGGVSGSGAAPGGWTITIRRPGLRKPIVIPSHGGPEIYACGTVKPGDRVLVESKEGSSAMAGNPGICF